MCVDDLGRFGTAQSKTLNYWIKIYIYSQSGEIYSSHVAQKCVLCFPAICTDV